MPTRRRAARRSRIWWIDTTLMVRRRAAPSRTMRPWPILRDARKGALLRMRVECVAAVDLVSLSPCGRGWLREAKTGEGFSPHGEIWDEDRDPSSGASRHLLPQGEKEEKNHTYDFRAGSKIAGYSLSSSRSRNASRPSFLISAHSRSEIRLTVRISTGSPMADS